MVKPATVDRIRELSRTKKSANKIVRQTRREGIGIRRTTILAYIREFRGKAPKPHAYKYTPRKYLTTKRRLHIEHDIKRKHIAIYGKVNGVNRRIEVTGSGKGLMSFLVDAVKHPPKKRISRLDVDRDRLDTFYGRRKVLDYGKEWDVRPTIKS
jgi:hypothetical protein